jgi:CubicO group peptidase (beta-lactamase class C family)
MSEPLERAECRSPLLLGRERRQLTSVRRLLLFLTLATTALAAEPRDISAELEAVRAKYKVPACASAVIEDGRIVAWGAAGLRRVDRDVRVTTDDIWFIGSCTKSMTATLIGVLVDEGRLRWDSTLPEVLPGVPCHAGWKNVTVWHLVTQRSGLSGMTRAQIDATDDTTGTPQEQRSRFARLVLARAPAESPGRFDYSNVGYGLLGAIIEQASGKTYEEMLRLKIFEPLGLKTAGFGAPATPGKVDQPWGHYHRGDQLAPVEPAPLKEFPLILAPAGWTVHMSLQDFARYGAWLSIDEPRLVKPETFARLQTPPEGSTYAGGLWKTALPGVGGDAVCHTGRMGGFSAVFHASPHRACVTYYNVGDSGWEWLGEEIAGVALKAAQ